MVFIEPDVDYRKAYWKTRDLAFEYQEELRIAKEKLKQLEFELKNKKDDGLSKEELNIILERLFYDKD